MSYTLEPIYNSSQDTWQDPFSLFPRLANRLHTLWLAWTYPFASFGKGVWMHGSCQLERAAAKYVSIGDYVSVGRYSWINIAVVPDNNEAVIILEDGCKFGRNFIISAKNRIHIERNTIFGPSVFVTDHNHGFEDVTVPIADQGTTSGGTIRIEEGCWIGFGVAIVCTQGDLVIGRNSVIGANSLVTRSIRPYSVVIGNPARVVKHYDQANGRWILGGSTNQDPTEIATLSP